MKYNVAINKQYTYIKVYRIVKKVGERSNAVSKALSEFVENLLSKKAQ